jgi:hypothetical protein
LLVYIHIINIKEVFRLYDIYFLVLQEFKILT